MLKKVNVLLNMIPLILSLAVLGTVLIWAPVCQSSLKLANGMEVHMKCFYTGQASILVSLILLGLSLENLIMRRKAPFAYFIIGIIFFILPGVSGLGIGICMKEAMACQMTSIWLKIFGGLIIVSGIGALLTKGKYEISRL